MKRWRSVGQSLVLDIERTATSLPADAFPWRARTACEAEAASTATRKRPKDATGMNDESPRRRERGEVIPSAIAVAATMLALALPGAEVPAPNILSAKHLGRLLFAPRSFGRVDGGLLYAATSKVPWATLLARTFSVDVKACARCAGRLVTAAWTRVIDARQRLVHAHTSGYRTYAAKAFTPA